MFNPKRMGACDYSVPSKIFACRFSGGRNELEMATANALNPNRNPIRILCCSVASRHWLSGAECPISQSVKSTPAGDLSNWRGVFYGRTFDLHLRLRSSLLANRLNLNAAADPGRFVNPIDHTHVGQPFATCWSRRAIIH